MPRGMTSFKNRVTQLLSYPPEMAYDEVKAILEHFGFYRDREKGSHCIYRHEDGRKIGFPKSGGRSIKGHYLRHIAEILELEEWLDEQS